MARMEDVFLHPSLSFHDGGEGAVVAAGAIGEPPIAFRVPLLSRRACRLLLNEAVYISRKRNYKVALHHSAGHFDRRGILLGPFGFTPYMRALVDRVVSSICLAGFGQACCHAHAFVVRYSEEDDTSIPVHQDGVDFTVNICLGSTRPFSEKGGFRGGALTMGGFEIEHEPGVAILHRGGLPHGAKCIEAGERVNLIVWCNALSSGTFEDFRKLPNNVILLVLGYLEYRTLARCACVSRKLKVAAEHRVLWRRLYYGAIQPIVPVVVAKSDPRFRRRSSYSPHSSDDGDSSDAKDEEEEEEERRLETALGFPPDLSEFRGLGVDMLRRGFSPMEVAAGIERLRVGHDEHDFRRQEWVEVISERSEFAEYLVGVRGGPVSDEEVSIGSEGPVEFATIHVDDDACGGSWKRAFQRGLRERNQRAEFKLSFNMNRPQQGTKAIQFVPKDSYREHVINARLHTPPHVPFVTRRNDLEDFDLAVHCKPMSDDNAIGEFAHISSFVGPDGEPPHHNMGSADYWPPTTLGGNGGTTRSWWTPSEPHLRSAPHLRRDGRAYLPVSLGGYDSGEGGKIEESARATRAALVRVERDARCAAKQVATESGRRIGTLAANEHAGKLGHSKLARRALAAEVRLSAGSRSSNGEEGGDEDEDGEIAEKDDSAEVEEDHIDDDQLARTAIGDDRSPPREAYWYYADAVQDSVVAGYLDRGGVHQNAFSCGDKWRVGHRMGMRFHNVHNHSFFGQVECMASPATDTRHVEEATAADSATAEHSAMAPEHPVPTAGTPGRVCPCCLIMLDQWAGLVARDGAAVNPREPYIQLAKADRMRYAPVARAEIYYYDGFLDDEPWSSLLRQQQSCLVA